MKEIIPSQSTLCSILTINQNSSQEKNPAQNKEWLWFFKRIITYLVTGSLLQYYMPSNVFISSYLSLNLSLNISLCVFFIAQIILKNKQGSMHARGLLSLWIRHLAPIFPWCSQDNCLINRSKLLMSFSLDITHYLKGANVDDDCWMDSTIA